MTTEIEAHLKLIGTFDPEDLTRYLGRTPSKQWRAGDQVGASLIRLKEDGWRISLGPEETIDGDRQVAALLDLVEPLVDKIVHLREERGLEVILTLRVYLSTDAGIAPKLYLDRTTIKRLERLGAEFDLDIMILGSDSGSVS